MLDRHLLALFLAAATLLAVTPGPGIFFVVARTFRRQARRCRAFGTFIGDRYTSSCWPRRVCGFGRIGYSFRGGQVRRSNLPCLVGIPNAPGCETCRWMEPQRQATRITYSGQGVVTEFLNPKTALFFLSFLPQFVNPALGHVVMQFLLLGILSVSLNTIADLLVVSFAAPLGARLRSSARFRRNQRVASGCGMIGLGAFVAFGEK